MGIFVKNDTQIEKMRESGRITAKTHELLEKHIRPGITTGELNEIAEDYIRSQGGEPSFFGYRDYPAATCMSINDEVIHGIPGLRRLKSGDIISIDIGVYFNKFHSDAARTHPVGEVSKEHLQLIDVTKRSFFEAVCHARHGNHLNQVSAAVEACVTPYGYSVVRDWCGHGIGSKIHEDPQVPNYRSTKRGPKLAKGMTLCIEPMVNVGVPDIKVLDDKFTVVTADGKYSAHYENTVLITADEPEILTL
jgi:methionyl aminopeptidase